MDRTNGGSDMAMTDAALNTNSTTITTNSQAKRSRVLLSCGPCRISKLKCDREQPCSQCTKKDRRDRCVYAPKPEKKKPTKGMLARLKRLEGMMRDMIDAEADVSKFGGQKPQTANDAMANGSVLLTGPDRSTFVGGTHCMAMLEDIEFLKSYFEEDAADGGSPPGFPTVDQDLAEFILRPNVGPPDMDYLLGQLPEKALVDKLKALYFTSTLASTQLIHRPTFERSYAAFWQDPHAVHYHWLAQLFLIISVGAYFYPKSSVSEYGSDLMLPYMEQTSRFRACAATALVWGNYHEPVCWTFMALLLFLESQLVTSQRTNAFSYTLSSVIIRLMIKSGLHRDASKVPSIPPFEVEMRRRQWAMALNLEVTISFGMGLPNMLQAVEWDTQLPLNLQDEDLSPDSKQLPPPRPLTQITPLTFPILKCRLSQVFGAVASQVHALSPPRYADVLKLEHRLTKVWKDIPPSLQPCPLEDSTDEPPRAVLFRFALESIFQKSRCVLHRRYLNAAVPDPEHDYSRRQCLDAAVAILTLQEKIYDATQPGAILYDHAWFIKSIAIHDVLLAATVVFVTLQGEQFSRFGSFFDRPGDADNQIAKDELIELLKSSHFYWSNCILDTKETRKAADAMGVMLSKLGVMTGKSDTGSSHPSHVSLHAGKVTTAGSSSSLFATTASRATGTDSDLHSNPSVHGQDSSLSGETLHPVNSMANDQKATPEKHVSMDMMGVPHGNFLHFDATSWLPSAEPVYWRSIDKGLGPGDGYPGDMMAPQALQQQSLQANVMDPMGWATFTSYNGPDPHLP